MTTTSNGPTATVKVSSSRRKRTKSGQLPSRAVSAPARVLTDAETRREQVPKLVASRRPRSQGRTRSSRPTKQAQSDPAAPQALQQAPPIPREPAGAADVSPAPDHGEVGDQVRVVRGRRSRAEDQTRTGTHPGPVPARRSHGRARGGKSSIIQAPDQAGPETIITQPTKNGSSPVLSSVLACRFESIRRRQYHSAEKRLTLQIKAILRSVGHPEGDAHAQVADEDEDLDQGSCVTQTVHVEDEGRDHQPTEIPTTSVAPPEVPEAADDHIKDGDHVSGVGGDLGDVVSVLDETRRELKRHRLIHERELAKAAKALPVYPWVESTRGLAALGLGLIVGEAGDVGSYANPAKLWKRMGLAVIEGIRQRKCVDEDEALKHGYSPRRRAVMYTIGEAVVKCAGSPYRDVYLQRKEYETSRPGCGMKGCEVQCRPAHAHAKARRYMEKRVLRDLWRAWRRG